MQVSASDLDQRRKRLLWRACHRGIKEMDLILGGFARARVGAMSGEELTALEAIIEIPDQLLLSWATRQETVPPERATPLLLEMLRHAP